MLSNLRAKPAVEINPFWCASVHQGVGGRLSGGGGVSSSKEEEEARREI